MGEDWPNMGDDWVKKGQMWVKNGQPWVKGWPNLRRPRCSPTAARWEAGEAPLGVREARWGGLSGRPGGPLGGREARWGVREARWEAELQGGASRALGKVSRGRKEEDAAA